MITVSDIPGLLLAAGAFGMGVVLMLILSNLRPWRLTLQSVAPEVAKPLTCLANEFAMLPWVFFTGALSRVAIAFGDPHLVAITSGLTASVTILTLWHLYRAFRCLRRAIRAGA